jgi:hypothetical protein
MEVMGNWLSNVERVNHILGTLPVIERPMPPVVAMFDGVLDYVGRTRGFCYRENNYIPLTAHSPLHLGANQMTQAWIVTHLGILGEELPSMETKLWPGSLIDVTLSQLNGSFERPWLFGKLGSSP